VTRLTIGPEVNGVRWLVTGDAAGTVRVWNLAAEDPATGSVLLAAPTLKPLISQQISSDNTWMVTVQRDGIGYLWDLRSALAARGQQEAAIAPKLQGMTSGTTITADSRWLVVENRGPGVRLTDLRSARLTTITFPKIKITTKTSPDGRWLVTGGVFHPAWGRFPSFLLSLEGKVRQNDALDLAGDEGSNDIWAFSNDSQWLINGNVNGTCRLWHLNQDFKRVEFFQLKGPEMDVAAATFLPDGRQVAIGSADGSVRLWKLPGPHGSDADPVTLGTVGAPMATLDATPDGRWLLATRGASLYLWALRVEDLLPIALQTVGRNLYPEEWERYFGGDDYVPTFPALPTPSATPPQPTHLR
jgi:WD40 repeat protein